MCKYAQLFYFPIPRASVKRAYRRDHKEKESVLAVVARGSLLVVVPKDSRLLMAFELYCKSNRKTRAIVKIAGKLLNRIRSKEPEALLVSCSRVIKRP